MSGLHLLGRRHIVGVVRRHTAVVDLTAMGRLLSGVAAADIRLLQLQPGVGEHRLQ